MPYQLHEGQNGSEGKALCVCVCVCVCVWRERTEVYFKELVPMTVEARKYKIGKVGQPAGDPGKSCR